MHTALRLGVHLIQRIRELNPEVSICMYGLYAELNADYLLSHGVDFCISGEASTQLVALVQSLVEKRHEIQKTASNIPEKRKTTLSGKVRTI